MDEEAKAVFEGNVSDLSGYVKTSGLCLRYTRQMISTISFRTTFVSYARYDYSLEQSETEEKFYLEGSLKCRCMDYHRQRQRRSYEDLEGEVFAAEEYRMQESQPRLIDIFSGKKSGVRRSLEEMDRMPENWQKVATLKLIEGRPTQWKYAISFRFQKSLLFTGQPYPEKYIESLLGREDWP